MSEDNQAIERRTFLCVLGATGAVAAGATPGCGDSATPALVFTATRVSDHPQGVWKRYAAQKVIVGRDSRGFFAISIVCPHERFDVDFRTPGASCSGSTGCTSSSADGALVCTSGHGSRFSPTGALEAGPADRGLTHFKVTVNAGNVIVDTGVTVPDSTRTAA